MVSFFVHSFHTLQFSSFYIRYFITVNIYIIFLFVSVGMLSYCQTITVWCGCNFTYFTLSCLQVLSLFWSWTKFYNNWLYCSIQMIRCWYWYNKMCIHISFLHNWQWPDLDMLVLYCTDLDLRLLFVRDTWRYTNVFWLIDWLIDMTHICQCCSAHLILIWPRCCRSLT